MNLWLSIATQGLAAARPTTPDIPTGAIALYYATDTKQLSLYAAGAWNAAQSGVPVAVGAAKTATAGVNNTYLLDTAAGSVLSLPAATGSGAKLKVIVSTTASSNAHKILTSPITDVLIGQAVGGVAAGTNLKFGALTSDAFHSIQMPFAGTQPSGGFEGDVFEFTDTAAGKWHVAALYKSGTTATTPFSTATT